MPNISIAIATYNGDRFLLQQLESITKQIVLPDEVVVSDDLSTDRTLNILREFSDTAPFRVVILENRERLGYRLNFMRAAMACQFEIVFFCDQDDIWSPNKIQILSSQFADPQTLMAYHHAELIDQNGFRIGDFFNPDLKNPWRCPFGFTISFRRTLLLVSGWHHQTRDHNSPDEVLAHDQWITLLAGAFGRVTLVPQALAQYRQHDRNIFGAFERERTRPRQINQRIQFADRLNALLVDKAEKFSVLEKISARNADMFGKISLSPTIPQSWRSRAELNMLAFTELAGLYRLRFMIYKNRSLLGRVIAVMKLLRSGAYRRTNYWSFGFKAFIRDIILGCLINHFISKTEKDITNFDHSCLRCYDFDDSLEM